MCRAKCPRATPSGRPICLRVLLHHPFRRPAFAELGETGLTAVLTLLWAYLNCHHSPPLLKILRSSEDMVQKNYKEYPNVQT
ncbi:hypothetical protein Q1695_007876 [Nippostrongylus brasiliensis]|nr:hypothetical protein Q1695_007876 [Nippostrongylus brasiliensis]